MMWALSSTKIFLTNIISTLTLRGLQTDCSCDGQERAGHCGGHEDTRTPASPHHTVNWCCSLEQLPAGASFFYVVFAVISKQMTPLFSTLCVYQFITRRLQKIKWAGSLYLLERSSQSFYCWESQNQQKSSPPAWCLPPCPQSMLKHHQKWKILVESRKLHGKTIQ